MIISTKPTRPGPSVIPVPGAGLVVDIGSRISLDPELGTGTGTRSGSGALSGWLVQDGTDQDHGGTVTVTDALKSGGEDRMVVQDPFAAPKKTATHGL